jgi:hypothetical protein
VPSIPIILNYQAGAVPSQRLVWCLQDISRSSARREALNGPEQERASESVEIDGGDNGDNGYCGGRTSGTHRARSKQAPDAAVSETRFVATQMSKRVALQVAAPKNDSGDYKRERRDSRQAGNQRPKHRGLFGEFCLFVQKGWGRGGYSGRLLVAPGTGPSSHAVAGTRPQTEFDLSTND